MSHRRDTFDNASLAVCIAAFSPGVIELLPVPFLKAHYVVVTSRNKRVWTGNSSLQYARDDGLLKDCGSDWSQIALILFCDSRVASPSMWWPRNSIEHPQWTRDNARNAISWNRWKLSTRCFLESFSSVLVPRISATHTEAKPRLRSTWPINFSNLWVALLKPEDV